MMFHIFYSKFFKFWCAFYIYSTSWSGLTSFQVHENHKWLMRLSYQTAQLYSLQMNNDPLGFSSSSRNWERPTHKTQRLIRPPNNKRENSNFSIKWMGVTYSHRTIELVTFITSFLFISLNFLSIKPNRNFL